MNQFSTFSERVSNNTPSELEQLKYPNLSGYQSPVSSAISMPSDRVEPLRDPYLSPYQSPANPAMGFSSYTETIGYSATYYLIVKRNMEKAISALDVEYEYWVGNGEWSSTLDIFVIQFYQLQLIMEQYCALMKKNMEAIQATVDTMVETDENMASVCNN